MLDREKEREREREREREKERERERERERGREREREGERKRAVTCTIQGVEILAIFTSTDTVAFRAIGAMVIKIMKEFCQILALKTGT